MFGIKTYILQKVHQFTRRYSFFNEQLATDLMVHFKSDDYGHRANKKNGDIGFGWVHYSLVRLNKPENILCVGSRHGFIPAVLAQAARDNGFGHVYFVDAGFDGGEFGWTGEGYWKTPKGENAFHTFNPGNPIYDYISLHVMTTKEFARLFPNLHFDYIYLDGDHSKKGVRFDYKTFFPRLRTNGFLVLHDISFREPKPEGIYGVYKLWNEIKKHNNVLEFPFPDSGLGVAQKLMQPEST